MKTLLLIVLLIAALLTEASSAAQQGAVDLLAADFVHGSQGRLVVILPDKTPFDSDSDARKRYLDSYVAGFHSGYAGNVSMHETTLKPLLPGDLEGWSAGQLMGYRSQQKEAQSRARPQGPDDLAEVFSSSFVPAMQGFETAFIQTNLRGFVLRADSFPGIKQEEPTAYGMLLNVAIADAGSKAERVDRTEQQEGRTRRTVQIPPRVAGEDSIEVVFSFGREVPKEMVSVISACIDKLLHDHPPA